MPVQWTCLGFFARTNARIRTPSAFARFQGTTRGSASQFIEALEGRGMMERHRSESDGRSVRFDLTGPGRALLSGDPLQDLNRLLVAMDMAECEALLATLSRLASSLADLKNVRALGTCGDCTHITPADDSGYCACMAAQLGTDDIGELCGNYHNPAGSTPYLQTTRANR